MSLGGLDIGLAAHDWLTSGGGGGRRHPARFRGQSDQDLIDAITIGEKTGIASGKVERLKKALARRGITWEGANPEDIKTSFDINNPSDADFYRVQGLLHNKANRSSVQLEKWDAYKADLLDKKMHEYFDTTVQPTFDKVQASLQDMLDRKTFSDEEVGQVKSELTSQVREQETNRLRRISATLGLRGIDPGSVAGAALVNQQAEETDAALTEALRRFGLDIIGQERSSQAQELGFATNLSGAMFGAKQSLEEKNWERLHGINSEIGSILEAANTLDQTGKTAMDAARLGFWGNIASGALQGGGAALSGRG